jgi:hypothetical protein
MAVALLGLLVLLLVFCDLLLGSVRIPMSDVLKSYLPETQAAR